MVSATQVALKLYRTSVSSSSFGIRESQNQPPIIGLGLHNPGTAQNT